MTRHIISIKDFDRDGIDRLLDQAEEIDGKQGRSNALKGRILATLFFEPSTRTRMSFESAIARLGGTTLTVGSVDACSMAKGETLADTIRVVSGYADAIVIRHPKEGAARLASEFSTVPVINAGDGAGQHPSQTLLDLYTIRQSMPIEGIDIALVGDLRYGRTAHSLAWALSLYNARLHTVSPTGLELPETLVAELQEKGMEIIPHDSVGDLVSDVDVLYVTRVQRERFPDTASYFNVSASYRITPELLESAKKHLIVLHPLPRVDEIDPRVDDSPHARYFEQSRNGVPVRMAMLKQVMQ